MTLFAGLLILNLTGGERKIEERIPRLYSVGDPQFFTAMSVLLGPPIVGGNQVKALLNGDEIFPSMLRAIRSARRSITFETYIYWSGEIGKEFADALSERARAGVKVHVLLDWVGSSKMDDQYLEELQRAGVQVRRYHAPHWYNLTRLNNRTHRKILVVDGAVGFTGGVGIADLWSGHAEDPDHWRDTHFRAEGPVVAQMQAVFMDNWIKASGEVLHGDAYLPEVRPGGEVRAQMFSSSPTGGGESMHLMYLLAITAASRSIHLSSAYFVPDELTLRTLVAALKRGVKIHVITPGEHTDADTVRSASRARWGELLEAGAEMYEYRPTMYHCKVLIVDGLMVSVGSTNFDNRSFSLNDEANLNIYDAAFAREQIVTFERDMAQSRRYTLEEWQNRPLTEKVWERTASLLGAQL
ncbi:MAG: cardiolipin synthase [Betaproteobacteria bacterium]